MRQKGLALMFKDLTAGTDLGASTVDEYQQTNTFCHNWSTTTDLPVEAISVVYSAISIFAMPHACVPAYCNIGASGNSHIGIFSLSGFRGTHDFDGLRLHLFIAATTA